MGFRFGTAQSTHKTAGVWGAGCPCPQWFGHKEERDRLLMSHTTEDPGTPGAPGSGTLDSPLRVNQWLLAHVGGTSQS